MSNCKKTAEELLEEALVPEEEQPYEVPENWIWTKFGTVAKLYNGYAFKSTDYQEEGIPVIRISDISGEDTSPQNAVRVPSHLYNERFLIRKGDLLIAMSGATTGKTGVYNSDEVALQNQRVGNIKEISEKTLYPAFKNYYVLNNSKEILNKAYGGAQPNISGSLIEQLSTPLPPLNEQKRIAEKVESLLNKIEEAEQLIEDAKGTFELRQAAILDKAFRGELTAKWREEKQFENVDSKRESRNVGPYKLPNGWVWEKLGELGKMERGKSKHRPRNDPKLFGGDYPFIQTGDVARSKDYIEYYTQTLSEFGLNQSKLFPDGTVCITIAANIADTAILKFPCCFPDSVVGFIPNEESISSEFVHYYITTIKNDLEHYAPATAQKNINLKILNEVLVPIPPIKEHDEILKQISYLLDNEDKASEFLMVENSIDLLKQSILSKAFRGELGTNDANEESAIELLKEVLYEQVE